MIHVPQEANVLEASLERAAPIVAETPPATQTAGLSARAECPWGPLFPPAVGGPAVGQTHALAVGAGSGLRPALAPVAYLRFGAGVGAPLTRVIADVPGAYTALPTSRLPRATAHGRALICSHTGVIENAFIRTDAEVH